MIYTVTAAASDDLSGPDPGPALRPVHDEGGQVPAALRRRGSGHRPGSVLVAVATGLLFVLGVGLFAVSLDAQYRYVFHAKHQSAASWVEALALDVGMAIFSLLALGLARAPAPAVLTPAREFTLTPPEAPAGAGANGNGHRDAAGFPWGGEDQ